MKKNQETLPVLICDNLKNMFNGKDKVKNSGHCKVRPTRNISRRVSEKQTTLQEELGTKKGKETFHCTSF